MLQSALGKMIGFLPNVLAALVILAIGLLVAKVLDTATRRVLKAAALHRRKGAREVLGEGPGIERLPQTAGRIVYWVLALVTIGLSVDALHLAWLSAGVARVVEYLPNVLAACLVVAAGYVAGNFIYRRASAREGGALLWARLGRGAVYTLAAFMALQQLGIATAIVTIAFTIALSAMAVAGAIAFGLGNRELAGRVTRDWYERRGPGYQRYEPSTLEGPTGRREGEAPTVKH
jgi:hypothetical protein